MMNYQLLVPGLLDRANTYFPKKEIITREGDGAFTAIPIETSRGA